MENNEKNKNGKLNIRVFSIVVSLIVLIFGFIIVDIRLIRNDTTQTRIDISAIQKDIDWLIKNSAPLVRTD